MQMRASGAGRLWRSVVFECGKRLGFVRLSSSAAPNPASAAKKSKSAAARISGTVDRGSATAKKAKKKLSKKATAEILKKNWLDSLTLPLDGEDAESDEAGILATSLSLSSSQGIVVPEHAFVIGIDPDFKGALAVLRVEDDRFTPEVFDTPTLQLVVGGTVRRRPDARAIVSLLQKINAPQGSVAFIENSLPFHSDGKQAWWSSGFGFGLWTGSLLASGISVVPVCAANWKTALGLSANKDESRLLASSWFPTIASQLSRKKDHGLKGSFPRGRTPDSAHSV